MVDLGAVAATWNVRHAREVGGNGQALDLCYLNELGASALVPLTSWREDLPRRLRDRVQPGCEAAIDRTGKPGGMAWLDLARRAAPGRGRALVAAAASRAIPPCDGRLSRRPRLRPAGFADEPARTVPPSV